MAVQFKQVIIFRFGESFGITPQDLALGLANAFRLAVAAGPAQPVPQEAYDRRHDQYRSEDFLRVLTGLRANLPEPKRAGAVLLGVTSADLFIPRFNFVFGEAGQGVGVAVISTHRLRPEFYGEEANRELFQERVLKEAVHELGHVFGLPHCGNVHCIMHFSNTIADTDAKGPGFCQECQVRLSVRGVGRGV